MKVLVKTKDLSRDEWLRYRTKGIGGSDVSIIAGINPYKSVYQLWLEKTGRMIPEQTDSEYAHFGTLLEPIVRKEFMERTGLKVRQRFMILQSEEFPFMLADVDGLINENGERVIFEAKTASAYKQDLWEEGVPAGYILQVQHYMAVTGARKAYVAALVGGNHFYCHTVERDDEIIRKIITMERLFWEKNVIGGVEPIPDGSDATTEYFNSRFRNSNGQVIELPQEAISVCNEYERIGEQLKTLETARNAAANTLKSYLREAEIGTVGDRKIMWKQISKSTVDTKRLKTEQPEIYDSYLTTSSYRRFSIA